MAEDDKQARLDELTAVESIYGDVVRLESDRRIVATFSERLEIAFNLPPDYPSKAPPSFEISAPTFSRAQKSEIDALLQTTYCENMGCPVLFSWIDAVLQHLEKLKDIEEEQNVVEEAEEDEEAVPEGTDVEVPEIISSGTITDRKSVFQAHAARIQSKEEAMAVLAKLKENTKIARATHNIYSWIVRRPRGDGKTDYKAHDCDDDGETGAASRVLNMMSTMGVENLMVVVSRWYGGVHLGPDRFRHINNIARAVIVENGFVDVGRSKANR
uniref:RWD domain-containing protein n=1 Tax=Steinernema glaseri TaxID=37863 RepID=A0A1I7ZMQ1_9BILA